MKLWKRNRFVNVSPAISFFALKTYSIEWIIRRCVCRVCSSTYYIDWNQIFVEQQAIQTKGIYYLNLNSLKSCSCRLPFWLLKAAATFFDPSDCGFFTQNNSNGLLYYVSISSLIRLKSIGLLCVSLLYNFMRVCQNLLVIGSWCEFAAKQQNVSRIKNKRRRNKNHWQVRKRNKREIRFSELQSELSSIFAYLRLSPAMCVFVSGTFIPEDRF